MISKWIRTQTRRPIVLGAALVFALPAAVSAAEPFYVLRLEEGVRAWTGGGYERATRDLRIACFGLLDEPDPLARCLTYLALAQAGAGDREAFSATFIRILDVEQRFEAYSKAELAPGVRRAFEAQLERWEPYEALHSVPAFAAVARRMLEARILAMPPADRRQELDRRLAAEPGDAVWQLSMAELELAAGNFEAAAAAAGSSLARNPAEDSPAYRPQRSRALCIHGRAMAALGDCETALRDLPACARAPLVTDVAETQLQCYAQLRDWKRGVVLLSELPPETRRKPAVRKLAKLFERERRQEIRQIRPQEASAGDGPRSDAPRSGVPGAGEPAATVPGPGGPDPGTPDRAVPAEILAQIEAAQQILGSSDNREELTALFERIGAAADRYPERRGLQHLAAEIAYRLRRWGQTLDYFERGGGSDRPDHRFYRAVALYETGDRASAARVLDLCLPYLEPSELVRRYAAEIHGSQEE